MRYSSQDRARVLQLLRDGYNPSQIAKMPGVIVPRRCIARWRTEWLKSGELKLKETPELQVLAGQLEGAARRILGLVNQTISRVEKQDNLSVSDLKALTSSLNTLSDAMRKISSSPELKGGTQMKKGNSPNEKDTGLPDLSKMSPEELKALLAKTDEVIIQEVVQKATDESLMDFQKMQKQFPDVHLTKKMFERVRELRDAPPIPPKWLAEEHEKHSVLIACLNEREIAYISWIHESRLNPKLSHDEMVKLRDKIVPYFQEHPNDDFLKILMSLLNRHISGGM